MGTRSDIIVHMEDGTWARIYCHFDGYLDHNGRILFDHYTSQKDAEALINLGHISSLGVEIGEQHDFDYQSKLRSKYGNSMYDSDEYKKIKRMCNAYGRDRGEDDVAALCGDSIQLVWPDEGTWTEYTYVWDEGKWWVGDPDEGSQTLVNLGDVLMGKDKCPTPAIKVPFLGTIGKHGRPDPSVTTPE